MQSETPSHRAPEADRRSLQDDKPSLKMHRQQFEEHCWVNQADHRCCSVYAG